MPLVTSMTRGAAADRLLVLIHGYGADERDLAGILPYLDPDERFVTVLPRGPVPAPPGYSWFDIGAGPDVVVPAYAAALDELGALIDDSCAQYGCERSEAVVAGFSQGGGLALALGLRAIGRPHPAGVLAMSPFVPRDVLVVDPEAAATVPVLLQHGSDDPLVPVQASRTLARTLEADGVPVVYEEYAVGHQVTLEGLESAHRWLDALRAGERPRQPVPEDPPEGPVRAVTTADFASEVLGAELPVIVDFWAPWCGPCRQVSPIVEQIAVMRDGAYKVVKVNIDDEPALAQQYNVQSIPMIALFRNGRLERAALGAKPRPQLEAELGMLVIP